MEKKSQHDHDYDKINEKLQYNGVLMEEILYDFKAVAEGLVGLREHVTAEFKYYNEKFSTRMDTIESVLQYHSHMHEKNELRWIANDKRWDENDKCWDENDKCWAENNKLWAENQKALTKIQDTLNATVVTVDTHSKTLALIK